MAMVKRRSSYGGPLGEEGEAVQAVSKLGVLSWSANMPRGWIIYLKIVSRLYCCDKTKHANNRVMLSARRNCLRKPGGKKARLSVMLQTFNARPLTVRLMSFLDVCYKRMRNQ